MQVNFLLSERVTSTGKFTIVAEIVFLLKKIYIKGDVLCRAVFKVKNLSCFVSALFPRNENKHRFHGVLNVLVEWIHIDFSSGRLFKAKARMLRETGSPKILDSWNGLFQNSMSWRWPKDTWALGTRLHWWLLGRYKVLLRTEDGTHLMNFRGRMLCSKCLWHRVDGDWNKITPFFRDGLGIRESLKKQLKAIFDSEENQRNALPNLRRWLTTSSHVIIFWIYMTFCARFNFYIALGFS